jgi:hypothetical protein
MIELLTIKNAQRLEDDRYCFHFGLVGLGRLEAGKEMRGDKAKMRRQDVQPSDDHRALDVRNACGLCRLPANAALNAAQTIKPCFDR